MAARLNIKILTKGFKEFYDMDRDMSAFIDADSQMGEGGNYDRHYKLFELLEVGQKHMKDAIKIAQKFNSANLKAIRGKTKRRRRR